jgi:hypothetical protein
MTDKRTQIKRWINKSMDACERDGEDFDALCAEVKKERLPLPLDVEVPAQYAKQFEKYVVDNKNRKNVRYPRPKVVAHGLTQTVQHANDPIPLSNAKASHNTARWLKETVGLTLPDLEDAARHVRSIFLDSTTWFGGSRKK